MGLEYLPTMWFVFYDRVNGKKNCTTWDAPKGLETGFKKTILGHLKGCRICLTTVDVGECFIWVCKESDFHSNKSGDLSGTQKIDNFGQTKVMNDVPNITSHRLKS